MTVPGGVWDPVVWRQLSPDQLRQRQLQEVALLNFAGRLAREQIKGGRHFVFRLPLLSAAWRTPALKRLRSLRSVPSVTLATQRLLTSSQAVASCFLDKVTVRRCISTASGFGAALVQAFEAEFDDETSSALPSGATHDCYLTTTVPGSVDYFHDVLTEGLWRKLQSLLQSPTKGVHEATGHRPPQRLARALLLSGAPPEAVQAARELKCDVCAERRAPKTGELEVCPLLGLWASRLTWTSWLSRMPLAVPMSLAMPATTDAVSKFQQASILPDKSAASVVDFMATTWLPLLGAPRTIIADQGREFIAAEFQDWFVLTDKADGLRSAENPMEIDASAKLVVPGFRGRANLNGEVRRDAPTGARLTQHLLVSIIAAKAWRFLSADAKSAFLKGDPYVNCELYITRTNDRVGPSIPIPDGCLLGFAKASLALLTRRGNGGFDLLGLVVSLGWPEEAGAKRDDHQPRRRPALWWRPRRGLTEVGRELGFREVSAGDFVWCGKRFRRRADGSVAISMEAYHRNMKPIYMPKSRLTNLTSPLVPEERRRLRSLLGGFQWLVAQLRFDLQFPFLKKPDYEMVFQPLNFEECGLVVVTDSSLGTVTRDGSAEAPPLEKVYSQACYFVLLADTELMAGRPGKFNVLALKKPLMWANCAEASLQPLVASTCKARRSQADIDRSLNAVPLTVVVDAKDVYDKAGSDTGSFGSQKSLAFTIAWLRAILRRPNTSLRWTSTANMFADAGTKAMDVEHLQDTLRRGTWSITYSPSFIKQVAKGKRTPAQAPVAASADLPGEPLDGRDPMLGFLMKFAEMKGWHNHQNMGINVAHSAKSYRTPEPRTRAE
ncbi:unnamed protein product, partial [Symbiodinium sp. KB8]